MNDKSKLLVLILVCALVASVPATVQRVIFPLPYLVSTGLWAALTIALVYLVRSFRRGERGGSK
jgi:membrane protein implicated in regulation of membrane protease activity